LQDEIKRIEQAYTKKWVEGGSTKWKPYYLWKKWHPLCCNFSWKQI